MEYKFDDMDCIVIKSKYFDGKTTQNFQSNYKGSVHNTKRVLTAILGEK